MEIKLEQENIDILDSLTNWHTFSTYVKEKIKHPGFRKHSKNISWMFAGKIASMVVTFIATAYIARHLGPTNYGQLSYAISYVGLFGFIAALGIDQVLYRDLIKYPEKRNEYMGSALYLRISASIITVVMCVLSAIIWSSKDVSLFLIFIVSLTFLFTPFQLFTYEFQAEAKSIYPYFISLVVVLILNILKIVVILSDKGVIYLALIVLLEPILYAIGYIYFRTKIYGHIKNIKFDKKIAGSILKDSFPLIFASAFIAVYSRIDQVMIKNMMDTTSAGLYSSAVSISEVWYFIPNIIIAALFPVIVNAKKISEELYYGRIRKMFLILIAISILTALPTTILSKYLITIIFGAGFIGALTTLKIYVWSNMGASLSLFAQQLLVTENLTFIVSISTFFGMIVNVLINIILIPKYGMSGAAIATLISYFIPLVSLLLFKKSRKIILSIFKKI